MRPDVRRSGWGVIVLSLAVALLLTILPLPTSLEPWRPEWLALAMLYWGIALPRRVAVGVGWSVGLVLDVVYDNLLGQHALAMTVLIYLAHILHQRVRIYHRWQQSVLVIIGLLIYKLLSAWVMGITGHPPEGVGYWVSPLSSGLVWPLVFGVLRGLRRHYKMG